MNKNIINTLPTTIKPDFSGTLDLASAVKDILPVIDSSSNILESVTRIVESKNNRNVRKMSSRRPCIGKATTGPCNSSRSRLRVP